MYKLNSFQPLTKEQSYIIYEETHFKNEIIARKYMAYPHTFTLKSISFKEYIDMPKLIQHKPNTIILRRNKFNE